MARQPRTPTAFAQSSAEHTESDLRSCGWRLGTLTGHTMERTPTLEHELLSRLKNFLISIDFVYRIRQWRRLESAGAEGLRGNAA